MIPIRWLLKRHKSAVKSTRWISRDKLEHDEIAVLASIEITADLIARLLSRRGIVVDTPEPTHPGVRVPEVPD